MNNPAEGVNTSVAVAGTRDPALLLCMVLGSPLLRRTRCPC